MSKLIIYTLLIIPCISFGQLYFEDTAVSSGVGVSYGDSTFGGGVSFCDFDGDGWDDITYSSTNGNNIYFFKNNNGIFDEIDLGIGNYFRTKQVIWVDYDNDGDKDLFATSISGINQFYMNNGDMTFSNISATCGLFVNNFYSYGASFGDIDNDGDLDVFISNRDDTYENQRTYLYENNDGYFEDITESAGINMNNELSFCTSFFDYNNDGYQDIYLANDKYHPNRLYKNNGNSTFSDVSVVSGAGITIDAMSTTIGDYNNDGWFDIYVTNTIDGNYLLRNNTDGTFTNVAESTGTGFYSFAWGAVFFDADNDTDLDLYVSGMLDGSFLGLLSAGFYENNGTNIFTIATGIGFENDLRTSFSNAIGDFNNDGLPDIIVMNDTENNFLWENKTNNANNWLKVKLQGTESNRDGIGSKIEIFANGKSQFRYTLCGEGYLGQNSNSEFFGLKDASSIDYIKVNWLSGIEDVITDIDVNKTITIIENEGVLAMNELVQRNFAIYPNPSSGNFNIKLSSLEVDEKLYVYDVLGRNLKTQNITDLNTSINLENFSEGIYFFKIESDKGTSTKKIIYSKN
jgi:hypothetical protein